MLSDKEIDWDNVDWGDLIDAEEKPEVPKAMLWVQLERMREAQNILPRWYRFKQLVSLMYVLLYLGVGVFMVTNRLPYSSMVVIVIGGNVFLLIDYFVTVYNIQRRAVAK